MIDTLDIVIWVAIALLGVILGAITLLIFQSGNSNKKKLESNSNKTSNLKAAEACPREDLSSFLEFDAIEDDMIIQDGGDKYVMVMKCQGINYDLMSETEMLTVEEGFANFLNTLKYPIQIYVQSRSLNLEDEINNYRVRLKEINEEYEKSEIQAYNRKKNEILSQKERDIIDYEVKKKKVLAEYGADIINYVEKMSLNRNILQRKYYIVVSYYTSDLGMQTNFTKEEAHDLAYSDLYTKCRSIESALLQCGVESKILTSEELAELLYIAYNKDDADIYNVKKALNSGFYRLYSTSQSVIEKRREAIENSVKEQAIIDAELAIKKSLERVKQNTELTYEQELSDAAKRQAMQLILDSGEQFEPNVVDEALNELNSQMFDPLIPQYEVDELINKEKEKNEEDMQNLEKSTNEDNNPIKDFANVKTNDK